MNLIKDEWTQKDIQDFNSYLQKLSEPSKAEWTQNIYATKKPCLAIKVPVLREIAKQIALGNFNSFLSCKKLDYIEYDILQAILIGKMQTYKQQQKATINLLKNVDSWVCTDTLKLATNTKNFKDVIDFSKELYAQNYTFLRRFAFVQLLKFAKNEEFLEEIYQLILSANAEKEYYVNMAQAWLICELMIYYPKNTLKFIKNYKKIYKNDNNLFIIKKSISKCKDSFRISDELKNQLKTII